MAYLGQAGVLPITEAANVASNLYHIRKFQRMQSRFKKHLERDAANIDYMNNIITHFKSIGNRVALTGIEPGTDNFERALKKQLELDMNYKGDCYADIYSPSDAKDVFNSSIWATVSRDGYVSGPAASTRDVGPIWATGCKNAQSEFRINRIKGIKDQRRFDIYRIFKEDLGTSELIATAVIGSLLVMMMGAVIKLQFTQ